MYVQTEQGQVRNRGDYRGGNKAAYRMQVAHSRVKYFQSKISISGLKFQNSEHEHFYVKVPTHHIDTQQ